MKVQDIATEQYPLRSPRPTALRAAPTCNLVDRRARIEGRYAHPRSPIFENDSRGLSSTEVVTGA